MSNATAQKDSKSADRVRPKCSGECRGMCRQPDASQQKIASQALALLEQQPHFRGRSQLIDVTVVEDRLVLAGRLPSYYLKQMAQEALRSLERVHIDNQIVVASPGGLDTP